MTNVYFVCWSTVIVLILRDPICQSSITESFSTPGADERNISDGYGSDCPPDSILSDDDQCICSPKKCEQSLTSCTSGFVRTLIGKATNQPGNCCDVYQCLQDFSKNCSNVICPQIPTCPPDSYRLPAHKSLDECCAIYQGCQCQPYCEQPNCTVDHVPILQEAATGEPGRCCPLYTCEKPEFREDRYDCLTNDGDYMKNGTNWTSPDFCTKCVCLEGKSICHTFSCAPCLRPVLVAGQCCQRCDDVHIQPPHCPPTPNCTKRCLNGNVKDDKGCVTCQCHEDCPPDCQYIEDENGDRSCQCNEQNRKCEELHNCDKTCVHGYEKDENNCDICECKKCAKQCSDGYLFDEKGFSMCKCKPWKMFNNKKPTTDDRAVACKTDSNVWREDGETWFDGCRQCSCISGREMCSLVRCSPFSCSNPVINSTSSCCPFCPDDPFKNEEMNHMVCTSPNGGIMLEGESLMLDDCTQCICHRGLALCRSKDCPPTPCSSPRHPADGECCSICAVSNEIDNPNSYSGDDVDCTPSQMNATVWREGSCVSCRCVHNKKRCYTELCDVFNKCKHSLTIKGKCCPICVDNAERYRFERICVSGNSTFKSDEEWIVDACKRCKCASGHVECTQKECSKSCTKTVRKPGKCCPSCADDDSADFSSTQDIFYGVVLLMVVFVGVVLVVCVTRHWRYKKQQIRLRDLGCLPPQYQYKYISNSPYDSKNVQKMVSLEKASLAPV